MKVTHAGRWVRIAGVVAVGLVTGCSETPWEAIESSDGEFRAEFPGPTRTLTRTTQTARGPVTIHYLVHETDDSAYTAVYSDYPAELLADTTTARLLDGAVDGMVTNVRGCLLYTSDAADE